MNEGEKVEKALSEPEEAMDTGATSVEEVVAGNNSSGTMRELLQDMSGEEWADTATPPSENSRVTTWESTSRPWWAWCS